TLSTSRTWILSPAATRAGTSATASACTSATSRAGKAAARRGLRIDAHSVVRIRVDDVLVADAVAILIHESHRLLEQARLGIPLRHRSFEHVQLVLVHRDVRERARFVRVGQLQEVA